VDSLQDGALAVPGLVNESYLEGMRYLLTALETSDLTWPYSRSWVRELPVCELIQETRQPRALAFLVIGFLSRTGFEAESEELSQRVIHTLGASPGAAVDPRLLQFTEDLVGEYVTLKYVRPG
jgi:hypothetical protein